MHQDLQSACDALGISIPAIEAGHAYTQRILPEAKLAAERSLAGRADLIPFVEDWANPPLDIIVHGSAARDELSESSDFDYIIVVYDLLRTPELIPAFRKAADDAREAITANVPGTTGTFGGLVGASDLVDLIGLERDTNANLTHRVLLLMESRPLLSVDRHRDLLLVTLQRYLYDYRKKAKRGVPRFLLNDVVRYWRTIAVDYQAKRWRDMGEAGWGVRYIKLRSVRKLAFAGTLMSLFMPHITGSLVTPDFLLEQFSLPPLARLSRVTHQLEMKGEAAEHLRSILILANGFAEKFSDEAFRNQLATVTGLDSAFDDPTFADAHADTEKLQRHLECLFGSAEPLLDAPALRDGTALTLAWLSSRYLWF